ncbi:MAG: hypothetical protein NVSMB39_0110 [Candidatus Saccharimonadales bacterium]
MQTPEPFDYQEECLRALAADDSSRQLIVMATGLGKTFTAAFALKQRLESDPGQILILCHQNHILDQWEKALRLILGNEISYGRYHGGAPKGRDAQILLASFQSMANGRKDFAHDRFRHVIVDESHHGPAPTYLPTIEYFAPHARLLGLTATPERADDLDITEIFGKPTFELSLEVALGRGKLTPVRYLVLTDGVLDLASLPTNLGKLSVKQLNKVFFAKERDDRIVELIAEHTQHLGEDLRMMVFCEGKSHADRFERLLPDAWAVHTGHKDHWQVNRIGDYQKGKKNTLVTVNKFNEGVDYPATNVVALLRRHGTRSGFLQQIGRALRPSPGKKEVLILDFAGNCERMLWVDVLRRTAKAVYGRNAAMAKGIRLEPFEVTVGAFEFDIAARRIIDVLASARSGYTKERLIDQIQKKAQELNRAPMANDVATDPAMASIPTFTRFFGSWNKALRAAGCGDEKTNYTEQMLVEQIQGKAQKLGRTPLSTEVDDDPEMASVATFLKFFVTWNNALSTAGLTPNRRRYTREGLIVQVQQKAKELGRTPLTTDVDADPTMASVSAFASCFGSWSKTLIAAGCDLENVRYTKQELIDQIKCKAKELGRVPNSTDVHADPRMAAVTTFAVCFGSWKKALLAAGFTSSRRVYTNENLILQIQTKVQTLGRIPTTREVRADPNMATVDTFKKAFGSWDGALIAAGYGTS